MRHPERLAVIARFHRDGSRLQVELWTTPGGDQIRRYVDGCETAGRLIREGIDSLADELATMHRHALEDGWIEEPPPSV